MTGNAQGQPIKVVGCLLKPSHLDTCYFSNHSTRGPRQRLSSYCWSANRKQRSASTEQVYHWMYGLFAVLYLPWPLLSTILMGTLTDYLTLFCYHSHYYGMSARYVANTSRIIGYMTLHVLRNGYLKKYAMCLQCVQLMTSHMCWCLQRMS